jgi:hypothetical protein
MAHFKSTNDNAYSSYDYKIENDYAKSVFNSALNLRVGGEFIVMSSIYLRGGLAYYGRAYKKENLVENSSDFFVSGGLGVKTKKYQIDLAYKHRMGSKNYYAFSTSNSRIDLQTNQVILSFGILF